MPAVLSRFQSVQLVPRFSFRVLIVVLVWQCGTQLFSCVLSFKLHSNESNLCVCLSAEDQLMPLFMALVYLARGHQASHSSKHNTFMMHMHGAQIYYPPTYLLRLQPAALLKAALLSTPHPLESMLSLARILSLASGLLLSPAPPSGIPNNLVSAILLPRLYLSL